nr:unnamed protein product [Haemonchus contortus]
MPNRSPTKQHSQKVTYAHGPPTRFLIGFYWYTSVKPFKTVKPSPSHSSSEEISISIDVIYLGTRSTVI